METKIKADLGPSRAGHRTVGYVDGVAYYPDGYLHGINQNPITIAGEDNGGVDANRPLPGFAVDEVALYTRLLPPDEVRTHYAASGLRLAGSAPATR